MTEQGEQSAANLARVFRAESGRLLAVLLGQCGDMQLAEDALQDACLQASTQWLKSGQPNQPAAWLLTVARRRLLDRLRKADAADNQLRAREIHQSLSNNKDGDLSEEEQDIPDERLKLIFTCCHPALNEDAQVALTLKTLCGLTTSEIARAFLISETTLQQRLVRAKRKIRTAGIPYSEPEHGQIPARLDAVHAVIYFIFNEAYSAYEGQSLTRKDLAEEAIRLAEILISLKPTSAGQGLLALMQIHHSRFAARSSARESFIPLERQDRSLWNHELISNARANLLTVLADGKPEKYQVLASISAVHAEATSWEETNWQQILMLYFKLFELEPNAIIELNLLTALANTGKHKRALEKMITLEEELNSYQPYFAARADLFAKTGEFDKARADYQQAIEKSQNTPQRDFLIRQRDALPGIS